MLQLGKGKPSDDYYSFTTLWAMVNIEIAGMYARTRLLNNASDWKIPFIHIKTELFDVALNLATVPGVNIH
jgi:hypothetical protein